MDRLKLQQLDGYKRILSLGGKDTSGPQMLKTGAFRFEKAGDYGVYGITKDGKIQRKSVQSFEIGYCDMQTESSYNKAFHGIADKMIQIKEKEKREADLRDQRRIDNEQLLQDIIDGKPVTTRIKSRNIIKDFFSGKIKEILDDQNVEYYANRFAREKAEKLMSIPGGPELYIILRQSE